MSTILIHDWDFFHYTNVIPNLECAKLLAAERRRNNIAILSPAFTPANYSKAYFRKDYDDGITTPEILQPNVYYGGRAFSERYFPFDLDVENIWPDFEPYEQFQKFYGSNVIKRNEFQTIIHATHVRLSIDGRTLINFPFDRLSKVHTSVICHDYNLAAVPNAYDCLLEVCKLPPGVREYRIGNKFPIMLDDFNELLKWLQLNPMGSCFYLQYNKLLSDEELLELFNYPRLTIQKIFYNPAGNCKDEDDFVIRVLPIFYQQVLFLRSQDYHFLLNIDTSSFKKQEVKDLGLLIENFYERPKNREGYINKFTLAAYCQWLKKGKVYFTKQHGLQTKVSMERLRAAFQYVRERNYEVFEKFYTTANVVVDGGKLICDWARNQETSE